MTARQTPTPRVSQLYPVDYRNALVHAGWDKNIERIDRLTDDLARMGYCRPRGEDAGKLPSAGGAAAAANGALG